MVERDENGRFVKGHKPLGKSPGRPKRSMEETALEDWHRVINRTARLKVIRKLLDMALAGDFRCIKLIIIYERGTPLQRIQTEVMDTVEIREEFRDALDRGYPPEGDDDDGDR